MRKEKTYILLLFLACIMIVITPVIPHHHHHTDEICMKHDADKHTPSSATNKQDCPIPYNGCPSACITILHASQPTSTEHKLTPESHDMLFDLTADLWQLLPFHTNIQLNFIPYSEKLYHTEYFGIRSLRSPPCC